jgi:hypothetical protein
MPDKNTVKEQFDESRIWEKVSASLTETQFAFISQLKDNPKKY